MINFKACFFLATIGILPSIALSAQTHETALHWGYTDANGPTHWSELDPANTGCSSGRAESPIDIERATAASLSPLVFEYHPGPWQVVDNGHTVQVIVAPGNFLIVDGRKYELLQFHFHHPSEDEIKGKHFDMELHMVHRDAEGHLAVVAILLSDGRENALIQMIWDNVPTAKEEVKSLTSMLDPKQLVPAGKKYYAYSGSLTTPPCTEGVKWIVLESPLQISLREERTFASLYPNNVRPIQALNGRKVQRSR